MSENDDIVKEFLVESHENLDRLDRELVELEEHPGDQEILKGVFRTIHTIKGTSGFLAFNKLEAVTHVGENLLARLRDGLLRLNPGIATALLAMVDAVREMLGCIAAQGNEGDGDHSQLIANLTRLLQPAQPAATPAAPVPATPAAKKKRAVRSARKASRPARSAKNVAVPRTKRRIAPSPEKPVPQAVPETPPSAVVSETPPIPAVATPVLPAAEVPSPAPVTQTSADSTIRVDVNLLDQLMTLVGELVLARNQILQFTNAIEESGLLAARQRLNIITTELQEGVMKTRMQPIGNIWSKFPRTVRDVALSCGKQVRIEMEGEETELDKTLIEAIKDPLTHLLRNAVDHGIERPEIRQAAGKDPQGRLLLRAFHEGGQVNIEISDDGAGLDLERIRSKALQKTLITSDQAARLSDREIVNLIFLPGFSTAEKVTNVSGRGVGLDVVRTHIEKIGGSVDVQTKPGQGTMVRMKIPLTLAIVPALIVSCAQERYAIPQVSLLELVRMEGSAGKTIETVHGAPVYRLRGRLLPLVYLNRELHANTGTAETQAVRSSDTSSGGQLDFAKARMMHERWLERLRHVLDGTSTMTIEQAGSTSQCDLGKWLEAATVREYLGIEEIPQLEAAHKHFHAVVRDVVAFSVKAESSAAMDSFAKVEPASRDVVELLAAVEHKVIAARSVNIVVLEADGQPFGLVVDEVNDTQEIVVKPLTKQLKDISVYAGATIMGDGEVALILDVLGLAQRSRILAEGHGRALEKAETAASESSAHKQKLVLFTGDGGAPMAVPLSMLARLENIALARVERSGRHWVTQYRGHILPLIHSRQALEGESSPELGGLSSPGTATLQVLVLEYEHKSFGLVVNQILDIVESTLEPKISSTRTGVLFSAVIADRVTELLDVPTLLRGTACELAETTAAGR
jgi:chemotaxis protein histidine kinase CheA